MNILDSRDLITKRDNMKEEIYDSFIEEFPQYEDMTESYEDIRFEEEELISWLEYWQQDKEHIEEIDELETDIDGFGSGVSLIDEDCFVDFIQEDLESIGEVPKNLPCYIVVDWDATADNLKDSYQEISYQGNTYLVR